ncbi:hypothetical protein [Photorhabdus temperata]|uniref:Uncharacterized protein n=1 Tax=Photorhabdus temperata J3 TaxID=1389415 RepID=U7R8G9_PHOTE|nr:hypothetical protein [Photorhabdus temperata]EQB98220.1 hypothetical protein B738_26172 [Photorhabdus temperata subsp. temperata M1021]ERT15021.1 hypothetical protein O185_00530 [Photorhabdus temperata J3]
MFGSIILAAILTTSSAITEDTGKGISSGIMAASASYLAQTIMPLTSGLKSNHSYQTTEAVDMAKALGGLKDLPEFIYVITDVNAHMADLCNRIWEPQSLALTPFIVEMVELRKENENSTYEKVLSELNCSLLED